jgi:hypothetical protein
LGRLPAVSTLLGVVSVISWTFAAYFSIARELNGHANPTSILGCYIVAVPLTWLGVSVFLRVVRHWGAPLEFTKGAHGVTGLWP